MLSLIKYIFGIKWPIGKMFANKKYQLACGSHGNQKNLSTHGNNFKLIHGTLYFRPDRLNTERETVTP